MPPPYCLWQNKSAAPLYKNNRSLMKEIMDHPNVLNLIKHTLKKQNYVALNDIINLFLSIQKDSNVLTSKLKQLSDRTAPVTDFVWVEYLSGTAGKELLRRMGYEYVARNVFRKISGEHDELFELHIRYPKLVFSHETALYHHNLTNVLPRFTVCSVDINYNNQTLNNTPNLRVIRDKNFDVAENTVVMPTNQGNYAQFTNIYKTICDIMNPKYSVDEEIRSKVVIDYMKREDADHRKLLRMAKKEGVYEENLQIVEVVLNNES